MTGSELELEPYARAARAAARLAGIVPAALLPPSGYTGYYYSTGTAGTVISGSSTFSAPLFISGFYDTAPVTTVLATGTFAHPYLAHSYSYSHPVISGNTLVSDMPAAVTAATSVSFQGLLSVLGTSPPPSAEEWDGGADAVWTAKTVTPRQRRRIIRKFRKSYAKTKAAAAAAAAAAAKEAHAAG